MSHGGASEGGTHKIIFLKGHSFEGGGGGGWELFRENMVSNGSDGEEYRESFIGMFGASNEGEETRRESVKQLFNCTTNYKMS